MKKQGPRVVYITAGAGGMYCGSCIRDNALVTGLEELGWDMVLLPLYTPIRVDESDHSVDRVFFGGINVYLQQKVPLFRHLPAFLDRWLDNPKLIRRVAQRSMSVSASELGAMTLSMVRGEDGHQRKEVRHLVAWLRDVVKPDLVCLTNLLVGGCVPALRRELDVPVLVTLQGDDVFLDDLQAPWQDQVLEEMRRLAAAADGFITFSKTYRDRMAERLGVPASKFHLTPLGAGVEAFEPVREARARRPRGQVIGYFARLAPEKGFDLVIEAFLRIAERCPAAELRVGGWLMEKDRPYYEEQLARVEAAGLADRFVHVEAPDADAKREFLSGVDVFCVPARFDEPKGLYALEAFACGLPVVFPDASPFSDMVNRSGGGVLFEHGDAASLGEALVGLLEDPDGASAMGEAGCEWVKRNGTRRAMAEGTAEVFTRVLERRGKKGESAIP